MPGESVMGKSVMGKSVMGKSGMGKSGMGDKLASLSVGFIGQIPRSTARCSHENTNSLRLHPSVQNKRIGQ
jgi:ABC-type dipeptide/oligopeptide/nickel transport system ATPase subunit